MGDEMKQTETGMPSLTLEPELVMKPEKEPEVQAPVQLMEVTQEMNPVQQKMAQTVLTPEEQQMVEDFAGKIDLEKSDTGYAVWCRNTEEDGGFFR